MLLRKPHGRKHNRSPSYQQDAGGIAREETLVESKPALKQSGGIIHIGHGVLGLYFVFAGVIAKLDSLIKITGRYNISAALADGVDGGVLKETVSYLKSFFGCAVVRGYESTIAGVIDKLKHPWLFMHLYKGIGDSPLPRLSDSEIKIRSWKIPFFQLGMTMFQGVLAGFQDTVLKKTQQNIMSSILNLAEPRKRIDDDFRRALEIQTKKFQNAEKHANSVFSGDDFIHVPTENAGAIGRRLRTFSRDIPFFNALYKYSDELQVNASAKTSVILVALDDIGRWVGSTLATISMYLIPSITRSFSDHLLTPLATLTFVYNEVAEFLQDYVFGLGKKIALDTVFLPMVSGVITGMYDELVEACPSGVKAAEAITKEQTKRSTTLIATTIGAIKDLWAYIKKDFWECFDEAEKEYNKYDKIVKESGIREALIKNAPACKRILYCRDTFLRILELCESHKATEGAMKKYSKKALGLVMNFFLQVRPISLMAQLFFSKEIFSLAKVITTPVAKFLNMFSRHLLHSEEILSKLKKEEEPDKVIKGSYENSKKIR